MHTISQGDLTGGFIVSECETALGLERIQRYGPLPLGPELSKRIALPAELHPVAALTRPGAGAVAPEEDQESQDLLAPAKPPGVLQEYFQGRVWRDWDLAGMTTLGAALEAGDGNDLIWFASKYHRARMGPNPSLTRFDSAVTRP